MNWSADAEEYYNRIYAPLERAEEATPVLDAIVRRGAPTTVRLAMNFALLDGSATIELKHLQAGYALWRYGRDTVRYLFSEKLSTVHAERLLAELKKRAPSGMTRTEISAFFGRNLPAAAIEAAIRELETMGLIRSVTEKGKSATTTYFYEPV